MIPHAGRGQVLIESWRQFYTVLWDTGRRLQLAVSDPTSEHHLETLRLGGCKLHTQVTCI